MFFLLVVTIVTAHSADPLGGITSIGYTINGELLGQRHAARITLP